VVVDGVVGGNVRELLHTRGAPIPVERYKLLPADAAREGFALVTLDFYFLQRYTLKNNTIIDIVDDSHANATRRDISEIRATRGGDVIYI
jgi:hypothetical protein